MIEKFYRRMLDGIPTPIIVANQNLKVVFTNNAFKRMFPTLKGKGELSKVVCCSQAEQCNSGASCRGCGLLEAFEDSYYGHKEVNRRVFLQIQTEIGKREIAFSINVQPLGNGLCMGVIDNSVEMEIARELQVAKNIQQKLLPAGKWAGSKRYAYTYIPCREIGGDLPDVYTVGNSAFGMIADVSGKGISAGMLTAFVKAAYDKTLYSPAQAITKLSQKFNELKLDERNYITMASVRIDEHSITYSTAGHNVPILLKSGGGITQINLNSPPISNWFDNPAYFEDTHAYNKGDIVVLLTDGVTESKNPMGEMFGVEKVMKALSISRTAEEFIRVLEENLRAFCGELNDDVTAIAFDL